MYPEDDGGSVLVRSTPPRERAWTGRRPSTARRRTRHSSHDLFTVPESLPAESILRPAAEVES